MNHPFKSPAQSARETRLCSDNSQLKQPITVRVRTLPGGCEEVILTIKNVYYNNSMIHFYHWKEKSMALCKILSNYYYLIRSFNKTKLSTWETRNIWISADASTITILFGNFTWVTTSFSYFDIELHFWTSLWIYHCSTSMLDATVGRHFWRSLLMLLKI